MPEPTNPVRAVELDTDAHARELERRAAAAVDPCERERLLYLSHFARSAGIAAALTHHLADEEAEQVRVATAVLVGGDGYWTMG